MTRKEISKLGKGQGDMGQLQAKFTGYPESVPTERSEAGARSCKHQRKKTGYQVKDGREPGKNGSRHPVRDECVNPGETQMEGRDTWG